MDPIQPSKHKRSVSDFLSNKLDKVLRRSPSPSASRKSSRASSVQSPSSPLPGAQTSHPRHTQSAPVPTSESRVETQVSNLVPWPVPSAIESAPVSSEHENPTIVVSSAVADFNADESIANPNTTVDSTPDRGQQNTSGLWAGLGTALRVLHKSTGLLPPLQSAIGALIGCIYILEEAAKNDRKYEELTSELTTLIELLAEHMKHSSSTRMSDSIANVARSMQEQARLIENKRGRGTGMRLIEKSNEHEEDLEGHYRRIGSLFRQLQADANLSIWNIVNDHIADTRLKDLVPVRLAKYDSKLSTGISRRTCTANTRTAILLGLNKWSYDPHSADLYWMNGMAGTGKTTIACSFSEALEERKQLAASFFCTRTVPECREVTRIIPTIAYQLARYSVPFQSALCEVLCQDPDVSSRNMTKQFERLLKTPLLKVKEAIPKDLVVVIDALDECNDMREVELLLSVLLKSAVELPLKFLVTSRPEPEIYRRMLSRSQGVHAALHLHEIEKSLVQTDIEVYLAEELNFMSPTTNQIMELAQRSGNLFIYAATLVRYIRPGRRSIDPHSRLQSALAMTSQPNKIHAEIDELYTAVLKAALDPEFLEDREVEDLRLVLWTAICVQEPVIIDTLTAMTGINDVQRVITALEALRSVIYFSETSGLVSTLHASFPDFMFDETRSKPFACDSTDHNEFLTRRCFEVMKAELCFNICKLESSFIPDSEVNNLEERVKQSISPPLWYACQYWCVHLQNLPYSDALCTMLNDFFSTWLLFWMEVLNLKREIRKGVEMLLKGKLWLKASVSSNNVTRLAEDACNFVTGFAANPVSQSTPHIYLSSLPFCSKSSSVFKQYWKRMRGTIKVTGSAMERRETAPLATWKTGSQVRSVAYSPDGGSIAAGCQDGTISIRNSHDGTPVAGPFRGHTRSVLSVAYSPDGSCIASGSCDKTIRVWSVHGGTLVTGPLRGHTNEVLSVAYSPDGLSIVTGSLDKTIRVWSAQDGALLAGPFQGHTDWVMSVAYSPDGSCIISGSSDHTIRVWSAHDGTPLAGPFKGHTDWVWSVAYSLDGTRIVSGSIDETIRVWSAQDDIPIAGPFKGHTDSVWSVAYSPDGSRIVSGSRDNTICVWNAHDGELLAGPLLGHTSWVYSVAYSPNSSRIVSGARDRTVRVWSAHDGSLAGPFHGRTNSVFSVAFSPDGSSIVSGFDDNNIRVWSADDGALLTGPLRGHTDLVLSVAYSPDGTRIVSGSGDMTIRVWNALDGALLAGPIEGHTDSVCSVSFSPDSTSVVSGSADNTIRVWSTHDGVLLAGPFEGHTDLVKSVAYSPDGSRIVSCSSDMTIRVWSAHNGAPLVGPLHGHTNSVFSVAFSPDGTRIVSGSEDKTVRVWSAHDGAPLVGPFNGHNGPVLSVAYSPDGSQIISGSRDQTIRVWRAHDGALSAGPFQGHGSSVQSVAYSSDGSRIVSGSLDETIRVWNACECASIDSPSEGSADLVRMNAFMSHWVVRPDGWVHNDHSQLLFWMPIELACFLPTGKEWCVIYAYDHLQISHEDVLDGEIWYECYKSE